jgi:hypothetical protein
MPLKKVILLCLPVLLAIFAISCSDSFDHETGLYVNRGEGFSINFPAGWTKTKTQRGALLTVTDSNETAQMSIVVQELPDDISFQKYYTTVTSQGRSLGARVRDSGEMTIGGADALWSIIDITVGGQVFSSLNYYAMNGNRVYSIICTAASEDFPEFEDEYDKAVESFRFVD